jgi:hypothetical protein
MPFTPAHASIVLPFVNSRYVSATGLVIGSMSPDFEYFIRMSVRGEYGHTAWGILYFDIPLTLVLALLFHLVIKKNLIVNLPQFFQQRLTDLLRTDFVSYLKKHVVVFLISAGIGAASHVLWDDFTHGDGYFVRVVPLVRGYYIPMFGWRQPLWHVLQHVSTMVGLLVVMVYIARLKRDVSVAAKPALSYWLCFLVITVITVMIRFVIRSSDLNFGTFVVVVISAMCLASVVCGIIGRPRPQSTV